jgi:hypothetical protein
MEIVSKNFLSARKSPQFFITFVDEFIAVK